MTPELVLSLGRVRELGRDYLCGEPRAFDAARELLAWLLHLTIVPTQCPLRFATTPGQPERTRIIGVLRQPLSLNDGRYLSFLQRLQIDYDDEKKINKMRVYQARFQYQHDYEGEQWIFRYDYLRTARDRHPQSHLNIRGYLAEDCAPDGAGLKDVHWPTGRISLEAIIRCLVEQFSVPTNRDPSFWRPVLAESERLFNEIAHKTISGPAT